MIYYSIDNNNMTTNLICTFNVILKHGVNNLKNTIKYIKNNIV